MADYGGLAKQSLVVRLGGGIDEANEPWVVDAPSVLGAENARFDERGQVSKRNGVVLQASAGQPSTAVESNAILEHQGSLALWHPDGLYSLDEQSPSQWRRTNQCAPRPSRVLTDPIVRGNSTIIMPDVAVIGTLACVVWQDDTDKEIKYIFVDTSTLQILAGPRSLGTSGMRRDPRVTAIGSGSHFVIVGRTGTSGNGDLHHATYAVSAATYTFTASAVLTGLLNTNGRFDVATDGGANYTVMWASAVNDTEFRQCDVSGSTGTFKTAAAFRGYALMVNTVLAQIVGVDVADTTGQVQAARFASDYSAGAPTVGNLTTPTANITYTRATIAQKDGTGRMLVVVSGTGNVPVAGATNRMGAFAIEVTTGYGVAKSALVRELVLAGKAFYLDAAGIADAYVPMAAQIVVTSRGGTPSGTTSQIAAPYGVIVRTVDNAAGAFDVCEVGKYLVDAIDKTQDGGHLSGVAIVGARSAWFVAAVLTDAGTSTNPSKRQADLVRAELSKAPPSRSVTAQSSRMIAAGCGLASYDGQHLTENTPPRVTWVIDDTSGGDTAVINPDSFPNGDSGNGGSGFNVATYRLRLVHRWVDAQGNLHRGAPSPNTFVLKGRSFSAGGTDTYGDRVLFSAAMPTSLQGDRGVYMEVEVYQADLAATAIDTWPASATDWRQIAICRPADHPTLPFKYLTMALSPAQNHHFAPVAYTALSALPRAYFDTELDAVLTPPLVDVVSAQSRVWGLSGEDRLEVWPSKPLVVGLAPEFSAELRVPIPHEGGDVVGLAALDDKIVVLKERQVYVLFGDPGDATGSGSTLQRPRLVSGDVGCSNVNSIVEGPFGVAFQSERGFYTLGRDLALAFVGERIKNALGALVVTSGVLVPSQSEVRWTLDVDGRTYSTDQALVWNYRIDAWSLYTSFDAVHACVWRGAYTRLATLARVYKETSDTWTTSDTWNTVITTPWIKLAGLQGFKRVWRILLLARWYTGWLRIEAYYDYDETKVDTWQWTATELGAIDAGAGGRIQVAVRPTKQKIESVKLKITERAQVSQGEGTPDPGRGMEFVALQFDVGLKKGAYKPLAAEAKK